MVEQRSPKPSVACSTRVSPAKASYFVVCFFAKFKEDTVRIFLLSFVRLFVFFGKGLVLFVKQFVD